MFFPHRCIDTLHKKTLKAPTLYPKKLTKKTKKKQLTVVAYLHCKKAMLLVSWSTLKIVIVFCLIFVYYYQSKITKKVTFETGFRSLLALFLDTCIGLEICLVKKIIPGKFLKTVKVLMAGVMDAASVGKYKSSRQAN